MKFYAFLSLCLLLSSYIFGQQYKITEVEFKNDPLVTAYFENKEQTIQWPEAARSMYEAELKRDDLELRIVEDTLFLIIAGSDKSSGLAMTRIGSEQYERTTSKNFMRMDISGTNPVLTRGRYLPLEEPEGKKSKAYKKLNKKYGDQVEVYVTTSILKPLDERNEKTGLPKKIVKAYRVTDVSLVVNEDVIDFITKHRENFMGYFETSEKMVQEAYLGSQFKIETNLRTIDISSYKMENSSFDFDSPLIQPEPRVYRATLFNSFWDFHMSEGMEEIFDVQKLEYITFIRLKESDQDKPGYEELKAKYGKYWPYNIIVQEVEEIPVEEN